MRDILNLRVVVVGIGIAFTLSCIVALFMWASRPGPIASGPVTAVLDVIPLPTKTPVANTATPAADLTPTSDVPPSPPPGAISVGAFVQVAGTGGDGLRMRAEPSLEGEVLFLGLESEVFKVEDGPRPVDGYNWWLLVAPYDENVNGWAVSNFLAVVQNP